MKTVQEIINQEPIFLNDWIESGAIGVIGAFEDIYITEKEYKATECPTPNKKWWIEKKQMMDEALKKYEGVKILFASYGCASYEGDAWVLFSENNELFEISGSHCSCYGLEGQWDKEPVVLYELKNRIEKGRLGTDGCSGNEFANELKSFLGI